MGDDFKTKSKSSWIHICKYVFGSQTAANMSTHWLKLQYVCEDWRLKAESAGSSLQSVKYS